MPVRSKHAAWDTVGLARRRSWASGSPGPSARGVLDRPEADLRTGRGERDAVDAPSLPGRRCRAVVRTIGPMADHGLGCCIETTDHHELTDDLDRAGHRAGDCYRTASSRRAHAPSSAEVCRHRTEGAGQLAWENLLVLPSHVLLPVLLRSVGTEGPVAAAGPLAAGQASWSRVSRLGAARCGR
jgi:hypothetical protein